MLHASCYMGGKEALGCCGEARHGGGLERICDRTRRTLRPIGSSLRA